MKDQHLTAVPIGDSHWGIIETQALGYSPLLTDAWKHNWTVLMCQFAQINDDIIARLCSGRMLTQLSFKRKLFFKKGFLFNEDWLHLLWRSLIYCFLPPCHKSLWFTNSLSLIHCHQWPCHPLALMPYKELGKISPSVVVYCCGQKMVGDQKEPRKVTKFLPRLLTVGLCGQKSPPANLPPKVWILCQIKPLLRL